MQDFPRFGLGTFLSDKGATQEAVRYAIEECHYNNIDCAWIYKNEEEVGAALHDVLTRNVVKREDIWVTSKLWNNSHHPEDVEPKCRETLKHLQLDYLDLYLIHWPCAFQKVEGEPAPMKDGKALVDESVNLIETWKAMQELVKKGLVKRIGVSNFNIETLERLRFNPECTIQPYTNQVECHLYMQQEPLIQYCLKRGITITTHTSIGRPGVVQGVPNILEDEELVKVSKEVNRPPCNVEIKFLQSLAPNVIVLVKSVTKERIRSNNELDFTLSEDQINRLKKRERCLRYCNPASFWGINVFGDAW